MHWVHLYNAILKIRFKISFSPLLSASPQSTPVVAILASLVVSASSLSLIFNQKSRGLSGTRLQGSGPSSPLDFVLHGLCALRPCDPRNNAMIGQYIREIQKNITEIQKIQISTKNSKFPVAWTLAFPCYHAWFPRYRYVTMFVTDVQEQEELGIFFLKSLSTFPSQPHSWQYWYYWQPQPLLPPPRRRCLSFDYPESKQCFHKWNLVLRT